MTRYVLVSNRVPLPGQETATSFTAALAAAQRGHDCVWFGWSGRLAEKPSRRVEFTRRKELSIAAIDLDQRDYDEYYNGYAHQTLWPLFHYRIGLTSYDRAYYEGYHRVNALYAQLLKEILRPDDVVLVQDYHLIPLGEELRKSGYAAPIGFYLHIPFPAHQVLATLYNHRRLIKSMLAYDMVGVQTNGDLQALRDYVERELGGTADADSVVVTGKKTRTCVHPFGIDVEDAVRQPETATARRQADRMRTSLGDRHLIISADRLDYTKGLPERLAAFELLLEQYPEHRSRVTMMQTVIASRRPGVAEYEDLRRNLEIDAGHLNGRYAEIDWVPLRYIYKKVSRSAMAGHFRIGRVGLMTPVRDGMDLLAKEYVAAQDPDDPGVLVLSRFAGAAQALAGSIVVNPHDTLETANALHNALQMSLDERRERWTTMMAATRRDSAQAWFKGITSELVLK